MQLIRLRPEKREEYVALHAAVWPEVEATLSRFNIQNYSIFLHGDLLMGYFEYVGPDYEADMASMATQATVKEWWALTDPCQQALPGNLGGWVDGQELWHLQ